ncbi:MAG: DUF2273 domain-containing protein [Eubacteriales bacterium]|nr:DUF2273 domain-containing protein [Eubacteriales bacterium]
MEKLKAWIAAHRWRAGGAAGGVLLAILFLCIGFFKTLLLVALGLAGYLAGYWLEAPDRCRELIRKFIPERFK